MRPRQLHRTPELRFHAWLPEDCSRQVALPITLDRADPIDERRGCIGRFPQLAREASEEAEHVLEVLDAVRRRCRLVGVQEFARRAGVDGANLAKVLSGRRKPSLVMLANLQIALARELLY